MSADLLKKDLQKCPRVQKCDEWKTNRKDNKSWQSSHPFLGSTPVRTFVNFLKHLDYMVLLHMLIAAVSVFLCTHFEIWYDVQLPILISPIVFPLAFTINTSFRRRDVLLGKISLFQSSSRVFYFCCREWSKDKEKKERNEMEKWIEGGKWEKDSAIPAEWMKRVNIKLQGLQYLLGEYLFNRKSFKREIIIQAIYEYISDVHELIDEMHRKGLPLPYINRLIQLVTTISAAFDEIRITREYKNPKSVKKYNTILILLLPVILAPYFAKSSRSNASWPPYLFAMMVAFVFSSLQGFAHALEDPFDGIGEDDLTYAMIDEWAFTRKENTMEDKNQFEKLRKKVGNFIRTRRRSSSEESVEISDTEERKKSYDSQGVSQVEMKGNLYCFDEDQLHLNGEQHIEMGETDDLMS